MNGDLYIIIILMNNAYFVGKEYILMTEQFYLNILYEQITKKTHYANYIECKMVKI